MKSIPTALSDHLAQEATTLATCWIITRQDGTVMRFTDHDRDITVPGSIPEAAGVYKSAIGYTSSSIATSSDLAVDQLDVHGLLDDASITEGDLEAGLYDGAEVRIFMLNWAAPGDGILKLRRGYLGQVEISEGRYTAELRGLMQALQQTVGRTIGASCDADLGDGRCKVRLDPPAWQPNTAYEIRQAKDAATGTVVKPSAPNGAHFRCIQAGTSGGSEPAWSTAPGTTTLDGTVVWEALRALTAAATVSTVNSQAEIIDATRTEPAGFFAGGLLTWTSGANAGRAIEVKDSAADGTITLMQPQPHPIQIGDQCTLRAGCQKRLTDCRDKFDNVDHYRGYPHVPGAKQASKFGGQK